MFNKATEEDMHITKKAYVKVYYEYNPDRKNPFRLYEREGFFDSWRVVDEYKTLEEAQESAGSRAKVVVDMGLFERGHRKGMMSWWEEPKPTVKVIPGASANFDDSEEVEFERVQVSKKKAEVILPEEKPVAVIRGGSAFTFQK
jgi:hypothetical protein